MRTGQPLLLSLLVRNLLDNAVRYSPGSQVDITLNAREFCVRDSSPASAPKRWRVLASAFIITGQDNRVAVWDCPLSTHRRAARHDGSFANVRGGGFEARIRW